MGLKKEECIIAGFEPPGLVIRASSVTAPVGPVAYGMHSLACGVSRVAGGVCWPIS